MRKRGPHEQERKNPGHSSRGSRYGRSRRFCRCFLPFPAESDNTYIDGHVDSHEETEPVEIIEKKLESRKSYWVDRKHDRVNEVYDVTYVDGVKDPAGSARIPVRMYRYMFYNPQTFFYSKRRVLISAGRFDLAKKERRISPT